MKINQDLFPIPETQDPYVGDREKQELQEFVWGCLSDGIGYAKVEPKPAWVKDWVAAWEKVAATQYPGMTLEMAVSDLMVRRAACSVIHYLDLDLRNRKAASYL